MTTTAETYLPDYYEMVDELKDIRRKLGAGYPIHWNDPLWKRECELVKELDHLESLIHEIEHAEVR